MGKTLEEKREDVKQALKSWAQRMRDKGFKRRPVLQPEPESEPDPKNYKVQIGAK